MYYILQENISEQQGGEETNTGYSWNCSNKATTASDHKNSRLNFIPQKHRILFPNN